MSVSRAADRWATRTLPRTRGWCSPSVSARRISGPRALLWHTATPGVMHRGAGRWQPRHTRIEHGARLHTIRMAEARGPCASSRELPAAGRSAREARHSAAAAHPSMHQNVCGRAYADRAASPQCSSTRVCLRTEVAAVCAIHHHDRSSRGVRAPEGGHRLRSEGRCQRGRDGEHPHGQGRAAERGEWHSALGAPCPRTRAFPVARDEASHTPPAGRWGWHGVGTRAPS